MTCKSPLSMKNMKLVLLGGWLLLLPGLVLAQEATEETGLDGDHFSLEGALELFRKASSPEEFEKMLNDPEQNVNNLDLNRDGEVDYIRVVDNMDGDVHAVILVVPVSETESQDVAVIEIEKTGAEEAMLQIVGDPDVFGEETIVEPFDEDASGTGKGYDSGSTGYARIVVNVWLWPSVRFIYAPGYTVWVSPWRWRLYPTWWRPWRPLAWSAWHVRVAPYRAHRYHVVHTHRVTRAHAVYTPRRTHSTVVRTRTTTTVKTRKGTVRKTTTKTKVKGPRGQKAVKKNTKVAGKRRGG